MDTSGFTLVRFRAFAGTVPTCLEISWDTLPALRAAPIGAKDGRSLGSGLEESHGLVIALVIDDAQNGVKLRRLNQSKGPGPESCGCVLVSNETVYARPVQDRLLQPNDRRIVMHKDLFHNVTFLNGCRIGRQIKVNDSPERLFVFLYFGHIEG